MGLSASVGPGDSVSQLLCMARHNLVGTGAPLTKRASAELARCFIYQHLFHHIQKRPQDEDRPQRGTVHFLDPLIGQAHRV